MKLDFPILLIDETVCDYGFRVLMSGYQPDSFEKNPIMLLQHKRMDEGDDTLTDDVVLPPGKWDDITVKGGQLLAYPHFDDDDDFALRIQKKVKNGFLNAASVWINPIEASDDEKLKLPGQFGPTLTKWSIREASIVDIPGCRNAVAIRDGAGKKITLSSKDQDNTEVLEYLKSFLPKNEDKMDLKLAAVSVGLNENATEAEFKTKLSALVAEAKLAGQYKADKEAAELKVKTLEDAAETQKITDLVDGAIVAKKLAAGDKEKFVKLATADFATTKELIDGMKSYEKIEGTLSTEPGDEVKNENAELMKLSFDELFEIGKLERLKEINIEGFKLKYKAANGVEYTGTV